MHTASTLTGTPILLVDDDRTCRELLAAKLVRHGYRPIPVSSTEEAVPLLNASDGPRIALVDWMMPGQDGLAFCRQLRSDARARYVYLILLTGRSERGDAVVGLESGADDFVIKAGDTAELVARIRAGERILALQRALDEKVQKLETTLARVRTLEGLISICMHCKRIRTGEDRWTAVEKYLESYSNASFTHALCAICLDRHYPATDV